MSSLRFAAVCAFLLATGSSLAGDSFSFTRLIDQSTPIPNGTGNFTGVGQPSINGDSIVFHAFGSNSQTGVYSHSLSSGQTIRLASRGMVLPGGGGGFTQFRAVSFENGSAAWVDGNSNIEGVYGWSAGQLRRYVYYNDAFPNGVRRIFNNPSVDGDAVAFLAHTNGVGSGVYFRDGNGPIFSMGEFGGPAPGGGVFSSIYQPSLSGHTATFLSDVGNRWLFRWRDGVTERVIAPNTPIPGGSSTFTYISRAHIDNEQIAFVGGHATGAGGFERFGAYLYDAGTITPIADRNTPVPDGIGTFDAVEDIAFDSGNLFFTGVSEDFTVRALYVSIAGDITRLVGPGDSVDGRIVNQAFIRQGEAIDGTNVAFFLEFTDLTWGLYSTAIPEPGSAVCVLAVLLIAGRRVRFPAGVK